LTIRTEGRALGGIQRPVGRGDFPRPHSSELGRPGRDLGERGSRRAAGSLRMLPPDSAGAPRDPALRSVATSRILREAPMSEPPSEIVRAIARMKPEDRRDAVDFLKRMIREGMPLASITVLLDEDDVPVALKVSAIEGPP